MVTLVHYCRTVSATVCALLLAACFGGPPNPADIKPVYRVMNSPLPVPAPRWNPRRSYAKASTPARQTASRSSTRKPTATRRASSTAAGTITVRRGDTLYSLARKHGVPLRSLISANKVRPPYALAVGQQLRLPSPLTHTVRRGETGYGISRRYGVNLTALMRQNGIKKPYTLAVGQVLRLPGGAKPAAAPQRTARTSTGAARASTGAPPTNNAPSTRGRVVALPEPPARSASGFAWPVDGQLASRYGPKDGGLHNDGINILAQRGTPVRSAEAGVVVYASNALEGYGNLLLLKHADGWLTAYAHNERLLVNKGDSVKRGQVIARVGSTGGVNEPQLHFEIRKGRRALDPLDYLKSRVAAAR